MARGGEFVVGVALGFLARRGGLSLGRAGAPLALAAVPAVLAGGGAPYVLLHNGALVPLFAVAVVGLASAPTSRAARVLGSRPGQLLGDAAFALYALQDPLWRWARALWGESAPPTPAFAAGFGVALAAVSVAVSRGLERPARRWLRRWLAEPPPPPRAERTRGPAPDGVRPEPSRA